MSQSINKHFFFLHKGHSPENDGLLIVLKAIGINYIYTYIFLPIIKAALR